MSSSGLHSCLVSNAADLPVFTVNADQIRILLTPQDLYDTLLVNAIKDAVRERQVRVLLLLDASRGLRCSSITQHYAGVNQTGPNESSSFRSSCELLAPLTKLEGVTVALYHNPDLRGWLYSLLPDRLNEVLGVQHIKAYVIDDSVLVTGANLSHEYFTARQDRAWIFQRCPALSDFYSGLIELISKFCYRLQPQGTLATSVDTNPMKDPITKFKNDFRLVITDYLERVRCLQPMDIPTADTIVVPLVQCGPYDIRIDENFTTRLFQSLTSDQHNAYHISLASGYFSLTKSYEELLVNFARVHHQSRLELLCASPMANGFLRSRGVSGFIPMAYRESLIKLSSRFSILDKLKTVNPPIFWEYYRPNWTFHAKGLWVEQKPLITSSAPSSPPSLLTLIGSSNFSYRSLNRDLESQLVVWTKNAELRTRVIEERNQLFSVSQCHLVTLTRLLAETQFRLP
ncbi:phospholipase D domain protein, partial [Opisthorchis viverrini]